jgi:hypothetical protein
MKDFKFFFVSLGRHSSSRVLSFDYDIIFVLSILYQHLGIKWVRFWKILLKPLRATGMSSSLLLLQ